MNRVISRPGDWHDWLRAMLCSLIGVFPGAFVVASEAEEAPTILLDDFDTLLDWRAEGTDEVGAVLRWVDGVQGRAMCLDYDFSRASGFALARRELPLDFPQDFELRFSLRGQGGANHWQFKLVDDSRENVWWVSRPEFRVPKDWTLQRYKRRHIDFAWGPTAQRHLRQSRYLELTVAAGSGGGIGSVCVDQLSLQARQPLPPPPVPVWLNVETGQVSASADAQANLARALDAKLETAWVSSDGSPSSLLLDLGQPREFGGVVLRWMPNQGARDYDLSLSDDAVEWRKARTVRGGDGGVDPLLLSESEARFLRLDLLRPQAGRYALAELQVRDLAFGQSANSMLQVLASESPVGHYPRGFSGQQTYWTVLGVPGGRTQALLSEDGAIEPYRGAFSVEPLLMVRDVAQPAGWRVLSWSDATISHSLRDGDLPIPSVHWQLPQALALQVTAFADGKASEPQLLARYRLQNVSAAPQEIVLALALRPLQVNPPVQFLNTPGGVSQVRQLALTADSARVNGAWAAHALRPAQVIAVRGFDQGALMDWLPALASTCLTDNAPPCATASTSLQDPTALASGAWLYRVKLSPGEHWETALQLPMQAIDGASVTLGGMTDLDARERAVAEQWRALVDRTRVDIEAAPEIGGSLRTALAHILINRHGVAIQPGTRSYSRSWIRDGAMTSGALMRLGHADAARDFLDWFLPFQFDSGKVPCCADARGADPVPEHDSHGELIYLIAELFRFDRDKDALRRRWPSVKAAIQYMDALRASERSERNQTADRSAYFGLLPPSISHEGYSDRPAYAYWDNFWGLLGYKDAVDIADALDLRDEAGRIRNARDGYRKDLYASLQAAMQHHEINFLPGAADRGDFDATSTTIALAPGGETAMLPQEALRATFELYWQHFVARREGRSDSTLYTPYEWRVVGSLLRLGWVDKAQQAVQYFMADRRPVVWNQWAEVVVHDPRKSHFIGDMPHGWVASDFIRSTLDMLAYERESDQSMVLAAGVSATWRAGEGVRVQALRTPWGALSYWLRAHGERRVMLHVEAGLDMPPGGLRFWLPDHPHAKLAAPQASIELESRDGHQEWVIRALPATLELRW